MTDAEISQRLIVIETKIPYLSDEINYLSNQITQLDNKIETMNTNLAILISQKNDAEKRLSRWKTGAVGLSTSVLLLLIGWLAKIALIVQSAHTLNP
ncbi:MAG TPA: hypothetical protein VHD33_00015 [Legionellaceae bacterium]|nr:hypothetical protein [Legionellaceae bacterium]